MNLQIVVANSTASYTEEEDEELRHKSNRTYRRILTSLPVAVASRYGYVEKPSDRLIERLDSARTRDDWNEVARLAVALGELDEQGEGTVRLMA